MTTDAKFGSTGSPAGQNAQPTMALAAAKSTQTSKPAAVKASETFNGTWPYEAHYSKAPGFAMHYIDEGKGETLLFLHGEPTWGYLFRHQIAALKEKYRVVVPDHMGFGKSETPDNHTYFLQDHIDNLEALVLDLDLTDITLVMHDFGGPTGMGLAIRHPNRIKRIISVNGPTPMGQSDLIDRVTANVAVSPWFQWILKAEGEGTLEKVLGESHYSILSTLKLNGFVDNSIVTDAWLEAYRAPFPNPDYGLGAIGWAKGYATGQHQFETPSEEVKGILAITPALAIWGKQDRTLHGEHFLPLFRSAFPSGIVHEIDKAGHYSPEDQPSLVAHLIDSFMQETTVSKSADNRNDIAAISSIIQTYAEGGRKGDAVIMKPVFRENATLHGYMDGGLLAGPIEILFGWVAENPPAPDLEAKIVNIDLADTVATARIEVTGWLGYRFTDQFTLLKENGAWTITSKVFHTY